MSNFILKLLPAIANHLQLEPGVAKRPRLSLARRAWATLLPLTQRVLQSKQVQAVFLSKSNEDLFRHIFCLHFLTVNLIQDSIDNHFHFGDIKIKGR